MAQAALGIDIGGTFTDLVIHHYASGERQALKVLTTHDDPRRGVMAGVTALLGQSGLPPSAIVRVVHATTLFTNALIERKGAVTGLITTAGFRDTLEIGRGAGNMRSMTWQSRCRSHWCRGRAGWR